MKDRSLSLYQELLQELQGRWAVDASDLDTIEDRFRISVQYWNNVKGWVKEYTFISATEERDKREDQVLFWDRELGKMERFGITHAAFIGYYLTGSTDRDTEYFVRVSEEEGYWTGAKFYDLDARTCSSHDHLVAMILAFDNYRDFVQMELAKLQNHSR